MEKEWKSSTRQLNNRGWGLGVFLGFIAILLFCLVVVGFNAYKLGIKTEGGLQFDSSVIDNNSSNNTKNNIESRVISAAMNYKRNEYGNMSNGQTIIVKVSRLVEENYLSSSDNCSGYVEIRNINGDISYNAYLKCPDYVTDGYNSENDN